MVEFERMEVDFFVVLLIFLGFNKKRFEVKKVIKFFDYYF